MERGDKQEVDKGTGPAAELSFMAQLKVALLREYNIKETDKLVGLYPDEQFSVGWKELTSGLNENGRLRFNRAVSAFVLSKDDDILDNASNPDEEETDLLRKGLLQYTADGNGLALSVSACRTLFHGYREISRLPSLTKYAELIDGGELAERELHYNRDTYGKVKTIRDICDPRKFPEVARRLTAHGHPAGVCVLVYGPPGTGKTELVHQIARESGRMLVCLDAAKLNKSYVGDTEKAVRNLFLSYRYACAIADPEPILFLNEADGILGRRKENPGSGAERYDGVVQTIFLQELETFEGILLATTNLPGGIDGAFNRRFLYKVRLDLADATTRLRIWESLFPSLSDNERQQLASEFNITGANIRNVMVKADILLALTGENTLSFNQIRSLCKDEMPLGSVNRGAVGKNGYLS